MTEKLQCTLIVVLILFSSALADPDNIKVDVSREGDSYNFNLYFVADAPVDHVVDILTDYNNISRLSPAIKSSRIIDSEQPDVTRVEIISENCILFFCKELKRVEEIRLNDNYDIETTIIPGMSDFKSGAGLWVFMQQGDETIVTLQAEVVPNFWVPPFIGPHSIKKNIRHQLRHTANMVNALVATHQNE